MNNIRARSKWIISLILVLLISSFSNVVCVKADTVTSVVMTYNDKTFSKQLYGVDVENIKAGVDTEGLKSVGDLCDNLVFQLNGSVQIDKKAVMEAVRSAIKAGQTSVNIDLKDYTPEKIASRNALIPQATTVNGLANAVANTASGTTIVSQANEAILNAALIAAGIDCKISEASTKFRANEDRAVNVRNAASKINGMILAPGQGMSADMAFMARTAENGYGKGNVISGGEYVKAMGGGICQVSSTLNLAVLRAGIIPTERHNHSHRSSYIGSGLDATISHGTLDYQFVNTLAYPIYISAKTDGGILTVSIYSNHDALAGITYEPKVVGDKMSNTTYLVGTFNGVEVSNVRCYSSKYKQ